MAIALLLQSLSCVRCWDSCCPYHPYYEIILMAVAVLTVAIQPRYPFDAVTALDEYGPAVSNQERRLHKSCVAVHESGIANYCRSLKCTASSRLWKRKAYHRKHNENERLLWKANKGQFLDIDTLKGHKTTILLHMSLTDRVLKHSHCLPESIPCIFAEGPCYIKDTWST